LWSQKTLRFGRARFSSIPTPRLTSPRTRSTGTIAQRGGAAVPVERVRGLVSRGVGELVTACFATCASDNKTDVAAFRAVYRTLSPQEEDVYPGVRAVLAMLCAEGRQLAICTNKPQALTEGILAALGLDRHFAVVVGGDRCTKPKPDPAHLHDILKRLGIAVADAIYVGDSEIDGEAAAAAGIPLILVGFGYALGDPDAIPQAARIAHFDELPRVLHKLRKRTS